MTTENVVSILPQEPKPATLDELLAAEAELATAGLDSAAQQDEQQQALDQIGIHELITKAIQQSEMAQDLPPESDGEDFDDWERFDEEGSPSSLPIAKPINFIEADNEESLDEFSAFSGEDVNVAPAPKPTANTADQPGGAGAALEAEPVPQLQAALDYQEHSAAGATAGTQPASVFAQQPTSQPHYTPEQQVKVGLLQGFSMLGGAGLAALAYGVRSGAASIKTNVRQSQFTKLAAELNSISADVDSAVEQLNTNGLSAGLNNLAGADREEFLKEFLAKPQNREAVDRLMTSIGDLATKSSKAALKGMEAGLTQDQLDMDVTRRVADLQKRHDSVLSSLTDHSGNTLADRLSNIAQMISDVIDKLFERAAKAFGAGPRPGM